jgi:hypothetical protein
VSELLGMETSPAGLLGRLSSRFWIGWHPKAAGPHVPSPSLHHLPSVAEFEAFAFQDADDYTLEEFQQIATTFEEQWFGAEAVSKVRWPPGAWWAASQRASCPAPSSSTVILARSTTLLRICCLSPLIAGFLRLLRLLTR